MKIYHMPKEVKYWVVIRKWGNDWEYFCSWDEGDREYAEAQSWYLRGGTVIKATECERA